MALAKCVRYLAGRRSVLSGISGPSCRAVVQQATRTMISVGRDDDVYGLTDEQKEVIHTPHNYYYPCLKFNFLIPLSPNKGWEKVNEPHAHTYACMHAAWHMHARTHARVHTVWHTHAHHIVRDPCGTPILSATPYHLHPPCTHPEHCTHMYTMQAPGITLWLYHSLPHFPWHMHIAH